MRLGRLAAILVMAAVLPLVGCDDADADAAALLNEDGARMSLSTLLIDAERQRAGSDGSAADLASLSDVDYWLETVDKELRYAAALESYWTESVREAVDVASAARERARGATGLAREAAAAEARDVLDEVAWNEWTETLIACVDDRISDDDVAQARDSRSGKDPAWQAQVRRADRLRTGAGEALREMDARRSLQRAFYACEMASQVAGVPLESGLPPTR